MSLILCILDGWGYSEINESNAIAAANTPNFDKLWANYPHSLLKAHGNAVGLPNDQMGNSEVGHITIGAGRAIDQDLPKINKSIKSGEFRSLNAFSNINKGDNCHVIGMISDGGVHSHIEHIIELCKTIKSKGGNVILHAITDGRDTPPKKALEYLQKMEDEGFTPNTICGRFYAMDRDNRAERTERFFNLINDAKGETFEHWKSAISGAYEEDVESDEFLDAYVKKNYSGANLVGDKFFIANFRADRVRQIASLLLKHKATVTTMTEYNATFTNAIALFPRDIPSNTVGQRVSKAGLKQLRLAETEKYAHVTYFFNGGREELFEGEDRKVIPSPQDVKTYDEKPEMSAFKIVDYLKEQIPTKKYNFICVNFANADMVGHSGNFDATVKAIEVVDRALGDLMSLCDDNNYELLITADHGNAESMWDHDNNSPLTAHSKNPVPLIYYGKDNINLVDGELSDIAEIIYKKLKI